MTLSARYIAGPYQGVSQAPPEVRIEGACEVMEDCLAVIPNGIQKRPPLTLIAANLLTGVSPTCLFMEIPRGDPTLDVFLILNNNGGVVTPYLFKSLDGSSVPLTVTPAAQTYLNKNNPSPNTQIRAVSVEDVTFITNRTVQVANQAGTAATRPHEAVIWVKDAGYNRTTVVTVSWNGGANSLQQFFKSGSGANSNDPLTVGTDLTAKALYDGTDPHAGNDTVGTTPLNGLTSSGFTVQLIGAVIYISHPTLDFSLTVTDGAGGTSVVGIKGYVQTFSDLPKLAVNGFTVRVAQQLAGGNSDYYVQFNAQDTVLTGIWKEVIAPGAPLGLDPTTMPVVLTATTSGGVTTWKLDTGAWLGRNVGDATLSPDPAFVGDYITDIKWWKGRPMIVYNGGAQLNASDNPYKSYTTTLATALDSDPIAYLTPVERKSFFKQAVTFDQRNAVFGDKAQGIVSTNGPVSASRTQLDTLATHDFIDVPVQAANHRIYFASSISTGAQIHELGIDRLSGLALIEEMSTAVPKYIATTIDKAATFESAYLSLYGTSGQPRIFCHCYRYSEQQRVQNAFYAWNLPSGYVLGGMFFKTGVLYILIVDGSGHAHYCQADLAPTVTDPTGTVLQYLDLRLTDAQLAAPTYANGQTTFTLPITVAAGLRVTRRGAASGSGNAALAEASICSIASQTASTVTLNGDWRGVPLWFGYPYASYFTPTEWYFLDQNSKPVRTGRLSMRRLMVDVSYLGYLRCEVTTQPGQAARLYEFDGNFLDSPFASLDTLNEPETVVLKVPLGGSSKNTRVKFISDSHLGFKILGYEWHGDFNPLARRVN